MNKRMLLSLLAILPFTVFAQQSFTIKGELGKVTNPAKAYLVYVESGQQKIDSTTIDNGKFSFIGEVALATEAILAVDYEGAGISQMGNPDLTFLYLENGEISVIGVDSISKAELSGTQLNNEQNELNNDLALISVKEKAFIQKYQEASEDERGDEAFNEQMKEQYEAIQEEKSEVYLAFIKAHPNSILSLNTLLRYAGPSPDAAEIEPLLGSLSPDVQKDPRALELRKQLQATQDLQVGSMAPDFTQNDPDGKPISLSSFKGQYVLIDFWASWCGPCRQENPNLVAAYNKFKDKNFTVFGVSLDRESGRNAWLKAIEDDQLTWTQVSDLKFWNNEAAELYSVRSIPQNYLLDPSGKIIGKNLRGEELHSKLTEILD